MSPLDALKAAPRQARILGTPAPGEAVPSETPASSVRPAARMQSGRGFAALEDGRAPRRQSLTSDDAQTQLELDRATRTQRTDDNSIRLLVDGAASFAAREKNIREADVILMKTYNFRDDATGRKMAALLAERARAGAKVFLQFDLRGFYVHDTAALEEVTTGKRSPIPELLQPIVDAGGVLVPTHTDAKPPFTLPETSKITPWLAFAGLPLAFVSPWFVLPAALSAAYDWAAKKANGYLNATARRDHEKYLVTWKKGEPVKTIMGGMNVGDEWAYGGTGQGVPELGGKPGFRDNDIEGTGPFCEAVLAEYQKDVHHHGVPRSGALRQTPSEALRSLDDLVATIADDAHRNVAFPRTAQGSKVRFVANEPHEGVAGQTIEKLVTTLLAHVPAGETVRISVPFFLPTDVVAESMKEAALRGVKFELLLNSPKVVDNGMRWAARGAQELYRTFFDDFPKGSLQIHELGGRNQESERYSALHQKLYLFGKQGPVIVGSSNLDTYSLRWNSEGVVAIDDATLRETLWKNFDRDLTLPSVERVTEPARTPLTWLVRLFYDLPTRLLKQAGKAVLDFVRQASASA